MIRHIQVRVGDQWETARALIDCGAELTLVDTRWTEKHPNLRYAFSNREIRSPIVGGLRTLKGEGEFLIGVTDDEGRKRYQRPYGGFLPMFSDKYEIVLGLDWMADANPDIDFTVRTWKYRREFTPAPMISGRKQIEKALKNGYTPYRLDVLPVAQAIHAAAASIGEAADSQPQTYEMPPEYSDFSDLISEELAAQLPTLEGKTHPIDLEEGATPAWGPIYHLAEKELQILKQYIADATARGWIRRSSSSAGAPVLFVPKKGTDKLRLCVDYRSLNRISKKDKAPIPLISEILNRLGEANVYTKLDLKDAYHRMRIREGDEWKTAFRCRYGHFEYQVLPFGLMNAPGSFQNYIHDVLGDLVDSTCIVYLDDILVYSKDPAEHTEHVRQILERLAQHKLYLNAKKCEYTVDKVSFLGFVVSPKGIEMEGDRVTAIAEWPRPRSVKDIQTFLGFAGFYRRFIKNYSKITAPLTEHLKGVRPVGELELSVEAIRAFEDLKQRFQETPLLTHFDPEVPLRVEPDASQWAIGAVLTQLKEGRWQPVAYYSRKLSDAEHRYPIPDTEMLAITEAFKAWRPYLLYVTTPTVVLTDHLNHSYLAKKAKLSLKQVSALDFLAPFQFEIQYRPGLLNPADALSRRPDYVEPKGRFDAQNSCLPYFLRRFDAKSRGEGEGVSMGAVALDSSERRGDTATNGETRNLTPLERAIAGRLKAGDDLSEAPELRRIWEAASGRREGERSAANVRALDVEEGLTPPFRDPDKSLEEAICSAQHADSSLSPCFQQGGGSDPAEGAFEWSDPADWTVSSSGVLLWKGKAYVPRPMRTEVLQMVHDDRSAGHQGVAKTLKRLQLDYLWEGMRRDVKEYVTTCHICQITKPRLHRPHGYLAEAEVPARPWSQISMDFITGLPTSKRYDGKEYDSILVIVDRFTKYSLFIPTTSKITADHLAHIFLEKVYASYGLPEGIVTDRGTLFTSGFWRTFCHLLAVKRRLSTAFHPQTDGQTERMNQVLEHFLRTFSCREQDDWVPLLPLAEFSYNNSEHSVHGKTPADALLTFTPRGPHSIQKEDLRYPNPLASDRVEDLERARRDIQEALVQANKTYARNYNKKHKDREFRVGDMVYLLTKNIRIRRPSRKLSEKYMGPFEVVKVVGKNRLAYTLDLPSTLRMHNTFNISCLEPARIRDAENPPRANVDAYIGDDIYDVEYIVDSRGGKARREYLVKWENYDPSENSWIPKKNFTDKSLPEDWERKLTASAEIKKAAEREVKAAEAVESAKRGRRVAFSEVTETPQ